MVQAVFILSIIVIIYGGYFAVTGLFSFAKSKTYIGNYRPKTRFAVIIPARNEGDVIGDLLHSLNNMDYPARLYDIYTLINNCTDDTRQKAISLGAEVIDCEGDITCKGDVLRFAFDRLKDRNIDAYVIFDADNVVHPGFLAAMNNVYQSGHEVAQGRKDSKNMGDNWISASYSLFYNLQNYFYNKARTHAGAAATINGTGFMVAKELVDTGFEPRSVTEDIELALMCLLKGHKVVYTDEAVTYDEQPTDFKTAWYQRKRWSRGILQCLVYYSAPLFKRFITKREYSSLDKILFMVSPCMQLFALIPTLLTIILVVSGVERDLVLNSMMLSTILGAVGGYILTVSMCIFTIRQYGQNIKESLSGIFMFMLFMLSWVPINMCCAVRSKQGWVPVKHCRNVNIDALFDRVSFKDSSVSGNYVQ